MVFTAILATSTLALCAQAVRLSSDEPSVLATQGRHSVEVLLSPPQNPYPQITAEIEMLQRRMERNQAARYSALKAAYESELSRAQSEINQAVSAATGRPSSFVGRQAEDDEVLVRVMPTHAPSLQVKRAVSNYVRAMSASESRLFEDARKEFSFVTDKVIKGVKQSLAHMSSFVALPERINIRVGTAGAYPRIASVVAGLQGRSVLAESKEREQILAMTKELIAAEHEMLQRAIHTAFSASFVSVPAAPVGAAAELRGRAVAGAKIQVLVHPPEEDPQDVVESLQALEQSSTRSRSLAEESLEKATASLLEAEDAAIQDAARKN